MSVERTLRYSSSPGESITLKDLRTFLGDAALVGFGGGMVPCVTIRGGSDTSKVGRIKSIVIEGVMD